MKKTVKYLWIFSFIAAFFFAQPPLWAENPSGGEPPEEYTVEKGDTLWDISHRFFKNPFKWPAIWGINEQIRNPDLIYPGNKVKLLFPKKGPAEPQAEVVEKVAPTEEPVQTAVEGPLPLKEYGLRPLQISEEQFYSAGFIDDKVEDVGSITRSFHERTHFDKGEKAGVNFNGYTPKIGESFVIYSNLEKVRHPETKEEMGDLVHVLGHLKVEEDNGGVYMTVITKIFDVITVGSKIHKYEEVPIPLLDPKAPLPDKNIQGYVVASMDKKQYAGEGFVVYIDKGRAHGVAPGDLYEIFENIPALKANEWKKEENKKAPGHMEQKVGAFRVLTVRSKTATGLMVSSLREIGVGEKFRSAREDAN